MVQNEGNSRGGEPKFPQIPAQENEEETDGISLTTWQFPVPFLLCLSSLLFRVVGTQFLDVLCHRSECSNGAIEQSALQKTTEEGAQHGRKFREDLKIDFCCSGEMQARGGESDLQ